MRNAVRLAVLFVLAWTVHVRVDDATIVLDPLKTFQTITGWEAWRTPVK